MPCRGIRGAINVESNERSVMLAATRRLLEEIVAANGVEVEDVASVIFTTTPDLDAICPAVAAREMGWIETPLLCMQEMAVPGSLPRCIRILIHWNAGCAQSAVRHIYLEEARTLRPDWTGSK